MLRETGRNRPELTAAAIATPVPAPPESTTQADASAQDADGFARGAHEVAVSDGTATTLDMEALEMRLELLLARCELDELVASGQLPPLG